MKKLFSLSFLCSLLLQQLSAQSELIEKYTFKINSNEAKKIEMTSGISSIALKTSVGFESLDLSINHKEVLLLENDHIQNKTGHYSQLIFPEENYGELKISSKSESEIELYFLKVPRINLALSAKISTADSCEKPIGIDQIIWRAGLPAPTVSPTLNQVNHCVIHHSAGSNTATDFTEVVRNIYLFHTNVNGWDDIGYNYLIAPDGTLYHGRDGQNIYSDDNVRGAHFCGKNTGTMGICLLGDFTTAVPQLAALSTLEDLLLWKLNKESLLPGDSAIHPVPGGAFLGRVVGHQDGCATACPGTFLFADIPGIIDSLSMRIDNCPNPTQLENELQKLNLNIYPNPAKELVIVHSKYTGILSISDYLGREIFRTKKIDQYVNVELSTYASGTYYVQFFTKDGLQESKLLIMH